jgi:hypothetical protein
LAKFWKILFCFVKIQKKLLTSWKNSPKNFNTEKKKRKDQQLKNFDKEQEIQLMMNNTYNKKPK